MVSPWQACFMFEGIGLILPTFDASKKPEDFPWIYTITMTATLSLVCCIGLFGYMAFGQGVQNLVLLDFQPGVWLGYETTLIICRSITSLNLIC